MKLPYKLAVLFHKLEEAACGPIRQEGGEFRCRCPAHEDSSPSLYLRVMDDKILIRCNSGCTANIICDRLDVAFNDLFLDANEPNVEVNGEYSIIDGDAVALDSGITRASPGETKSNIESSTDKDAAGNSPTRHKVYSSLLSALELTSDHFNDLRRRQLCADVIAKLGYKSADPVKIGKAVDLLLTNHGADQLQLVPGFEAKNGRIVLLATKGILIPVRGPAGGIMALKIRHDAGFNGPKYAWVSSKNTSCGSPVHVPLGIQMPSPTVRLTEGELKADVATHLSGMPTISAPGVSNWHLAMPVLKALGATQVLLAFDQDGKPSTLAAMDQAMHGMAREGFEVRVEWWDGSVGKGIDDLLAAGQKPEVISGLSAAVRVSDLLAGPKVEAEADEEPGVLPFPVDALPPALATFCLEVAAATATPSDFAGNTLLAVAGAAIGNSRSLCLKPNVWYESPRFYVLNVGDPSCGKTPAMKAVLKTYQAIQLKCLKKYELEKAEYDDDKAAYEKAVKGGNAVAVTKAKPVKKPKIPPSPQEPKLPDRLVVNNVTVESLATIMEKNPRGLLMYQDEGVAWVRGMGQYKGGKGDDKQFWLSAWSGETYLVDRKSQGAVPITIPRPFINVVCGLPPDMLGEMGDYQGRNDGFLARPLFVMPMASPGADWTDVSLSTPAAQAWEKTLTDLRKFAMVKLSDGFPGYKVVNFSAAAKEKWVEWWNAHAAEIRSSDLPLTLIAPWGKLKSYAARLALVLHYLWLVQTDQDEGTLDVASVERAVRLIDYYKSHLRLVYGRLRQTPDENRVLEVLDWIRRRPGGQCCPRDLANAKKVTPTSEAKKLLKELEERGYGRTEWRAAKNGRSVPWFVLDPK